MTAEAKIRISTDGAQALSLLRSMREQFAQIGKDGAKAADAIDTQWQAATARIAAGLNQVSGIKRELSTLGTGALSGATAEAGRFAGNLSSARAAAVQLVAALAGAETARKGAELADAYSGMTARLGIATKSQTEFNQAMATAQRLSALYGGSLNATAASFTRTLSSIRPLNGTIREATNVTEALLASLKVSGASAEESSAAVLQFGQALGKGALNGDEFNSVAEAAPRLLSALADGLGVPTAALKEMGAQGQLTTAKIVQGLTRALPQLRQEAASIPITIGAAVQQVNNQLLTYVGQASKASGASQLIVDALRSLGDNIGPIITGLTTLAAVVGVTYVGKLAAGAAAAIEFAIQQRVLAAAAASAAAEMGMVGAAAGTLTSAIAGPVGLVVALGALAAGWIALGAAKNKAAKDAQTPDDLRKERADIQAQLDQLNARRKAGKVNASDGADEARSLDRQLAALDARLAEIEQRKADALAMSGGPRSGSTQDQLLDPATIQAIENEFKTRDSIEKGFRAKRDAYTLAKDAEINMARAHGTMESVQQLEAQKTAVLAKLEKERQKALKDLDKDGEVSRLAQARDTYDKQAALQADSLQRTAQAARQAYDDGLTSYRAYLAARAVAEDQANAAEIVQLQKQLAAQQKALAENRAQRSKADTANERAGADDAIAKGLDTIQKLEVDIEKKKRDQVDAARARRREEAQIVEELRKQREETDAMLTKATGAETPDSVTRSVRKQYEPQLKAALQNDQDPAPLLKLIDVETERAKFDLLVRQFQERRDALSSAESAVTAQRDAGLITESQAEARILELRQQSVQALRDGATAIADQSKKLDEVAGKPQAKEAQTARTAGTDVTKVADVRTEFEKTAKSSAMSSISTELTNILDGSKKASEGLRDMVGNFAKSMLDLIAKKLGEQLVTSLLGSGGAGGAGGSSSGGWVQAAASWAATFFHSGGVVSSGGGVRSMPTSTWAMAPRYHTGGIAGLAPGEVPAILKAGEEVLTADDPRHIKNMSSQNGGMSVTTQINISGAAGGESDQATAAGDLVATITSVVDAWAVKNSRPGGILSGSRS
jgi:tape measure domain-containing protein